MTAEEKAIIYDECLRESDYLQRINSKIRSENPINVPPELQETLTKNTNRINLLVKRLQSLFD